MIEKRVELQESLTVLCFSGHPDVPVKMFEEGFVDFKVGLFIVGEDSAEVFEGPSIAVDIHVPPFYQKVSQVEVLLHEESNVDCSDCKEKSCLVLLHHLHESPISLDEPEDHLQGEHPSSSEVSLGVLTLETQPHPLFARPLRRLLEVLGIEALDEIPPFLVFEKDVGFRFEGVEALKFFLGEGVVFAEEALSAVFGVGVGGGFGGQQTGLCLHLKRNYHFHQK